MDTGSTYYWCIAHDKVEDERNFCRSSDRLGPYASAAAAQNALADVHERNDRLDAEDRAWNDPDNA